MSSPVAGESNPSVCTSSAATALSVGSNMPVGGVQSQNPTQGLVHWMSAVMAEHMTSNSHHDPTVGMHYMWNGGVDVSNPKSYAYFLYRQNVCVCRTKRLNDLILFLP